MHNSAHRRHPCDMNVPLKASEQLFAYSNIVADVWRTGLSVLLVMKMKSGRMSLPF